MKKQVAILDPKTNVFLTLASRALNGGQLPSLSILKAYQDKLTALKNEYADNETIGHLHEVVSVALQEANIQTKG